MKHESYIWSSAHSGGLGVIRELLLRNPPVFHVVQLRSALAVFSWIWPQPSTPVALTPVKRQHPALPLLVLLICLLLLLLLIRASQMHAGASGHLVLGRRQAVNYWHQWGRFFFVFGALLSYTLGTHKQDYYGLVFCQREQPGGLVLTGNLRVSLSLLWDVPFRAPQARQAQSSGGSLRCEVMQMTCACVRTISFLECSAQCTEAWEMTMKDWNQHKIYCAHKQTSQATHTSPGCKRPFKKAF